MSVFFNAPSLRRATFLLACAMTLAGIVHISAILLIPRSYHSKAFSSEFDLLQTHSTKLIDENGIAGWSPRFLDPATAIAVCTYNLSRQPLRLTVPTGDEILTLSFHGTDGRVFYALSDRAAQKNTIELVLMTRRQLDEALNADDEDEVAKDVRLLSPVVTGLIVVRVLALQPSEKKAAKARALQMRCTPDANGLSQ